MKKIYVLLSAVLFGAGAFAQGDDCATAVPVTPGIITADGPSSGGGALGSGNSGTNADWYSFTPTCDGIINVDNCGTVDSKMYIFDGTAGCATITSNEIGSFDDNCGLSSSASNIAVTGGNTYYIEWTDRWTGQGFDWNLSYTNNTFFPNTSATPTSVTGVISWDAFGAETAWNVEYGVQGFTPGSGIIIAVTPTTGTTITGLNPETTYDVIITDPNDACVMSTISFTTLPLCATPTAVSNTPPGAFDALVSWNAGGLETNWEVEYGAQGYILGAGTTDAISGATNDPISGLDQLSCYDYYVRAVCDLDMADGVDTVSLWVGPTNFCTIASCLEPSALTATVTTPNTVDLDWTQNGLEPEWEIEYGMAGFTPGTGTASVVNTHPTGINGLTADTDYDYYVRAICGAGDSSVWVGPITFHTTISCAQVSGLNISSLTTTSVDLGWSFGAVETEWNVEYGAAGFAQGAGTTVNISNTASTNVTGLTPGTDYEFYVQAICGAGDSAVWVGPFSFTTVISCPEPTNLSAINISTQHANLLFQAGGSELNWNIEWGNAGFTADNSEELGSVMNTLNNIHLATGLNPCGTYDYYVQATCGVGDLSTWAGPYTFSTLVGIPTAPYIESFDGNLGTPNCWTNTGSELWQFQVSGGSGPGYGVTGSVDHTSGNGNFAWIDASGGIGANELTSPMIDFSSLTTPYVGFWFLSNNTSDVAQNNITLEAWDGTMWTALGTYSGNNADWTKVEYIIPASIPTTSQFRLVQAEGSFGGNSFNNDLLVDDFYVVDGPPCIVAEAGTAVAGPFCTDGTTDIFDAITGQTEDNGTWFFPSATTPGAQSFAANNGSLVLTGLDAGVDYNFDYVVTNACGSDTVSTIYNWAMQPNAGGDGTVTSCQNVDVNLINAVQGTVEMGGTWNDDDNATGLVNGVLNTVNVTPGTYNFSYVVDNGTCSDTSIVAVTVDACLGVDANEVSTLEVYPNPVNSELTITNLNVEGSAIITLTDVQGKIVYTTTVSNVNGTFKLDVSNFENGIYIIEVTSELTSQKVRVVKH